MPKLFESLFGKKAEKITQPTGFGTLPQFGQDVFQQVAERGTELSQDPSLFAPAGLTSEQQASLGTLTAGLQPTSPEAFQQGLTTFGDPFQEQVIQNVIRDIQEAGAGQFSDIGSMASAAGGFGGTRQALLESELQKNIQQSIGDVSGQLRSQGFQQAADRTLGDISRSQQIAPTLFGLGEVGRGIQTQQQQAPLQAVNFLQGLTSGLPSGGGTIGFGGEQKGFLGSGGGIDPKVLAAGAAALSDERLKRNIRKAGKENGHNIYEFEYKWSPKKYIGVMAQEVAKKMPDAIQMVMGYMAVDYDKLGIKMRAI